MSTHNQPLAYVIRTARQTQAMTQGELAARIGVNQSTISFWERGTEIPTVEHIIQLALVLPQIVESLEGRERVLLMRVLRLERDLFPGRCACSGGSVETSTGS
jgi:transcriptional regulator with XRE-family HTH domain